MAYRRWWLAAKLHWPGRSTVCRSWGAAGAATPCRGLALVPGPGLRTQSGLHLLAQGQHCCHLCRLQQQLSGVSQTRCRLFCCIHIPSKEAQPGAAQGLRLVQELDPKQATHSPPPRPSSPRLILAHSTGCTCRKLPLYARANLCSMLPVSSWLGGFSKLISKRWPNTKWLSTDGCRPAIKDSAVL